MADNQYYWNVFQNFICHSANEMNMQQIKQLETNDYIDQIKKAIYDIGSTQYFPQNESIESFNQMKGETQGPLSCSAVQRV